MSLQWIGRFYFRICNSWRSVTFSWLRHVSIAAFLENMTCFWLTFSSNASDEKMSLPLDLFK